MVEFKAVVSYPDGHAETIKIDQQKSSALLGMRIGEKLSGSVLGKPEFDLLITGGSDSAGFPMVSSIQGGALVRVMRRSDGRMKRVNRRGSMITESIAQINLKAVKKVEQGA